MLVGSYGSLVMKDNTIKIPKKLQGDFKSSIIVSFDASLECIVIIPVERLPKIQKKAEKANSMFVSILNNSKTYLVEKTEVLKIDPNFLQLAGIKRECVFLGMLDYVELWDKEKFESYFASMDEEYIKEQLKKFGF